MDLDCKHKVSRFEAQLRAMHPDVYARVMNLMRWADRERWEQLGGDEGIEKAWPEIEYIDYNADREGEPQYIEPHVDNKSAVTLIIMLTDPSGFTGGVNCFRRACGEGEKKTDNHREVRLELGQAAIFRGEKLLHWITPVTRGRRRVLQCELSRS